MPYVNVHGVNLYYEEYGTGPAVILTPGGRVDRNGLRPMNNGVRSTWPALMRGTREGGKPRDKSSATSSHEHVDRPDLIPMLTRGTCVKGP